MGKKIYFKNLFVPFCSDWTNIRLVKKHFTLDPTVDYGQCLLVEEDNEMQLNENELLCADIRLHVLDYYKRSQSYLWKPNVGDEVFWVTLLDPSAVLQPRVKSAIHAANMRYYHANCFRSRKEAETLLEIILFILRKYHKLP